MERCPICRARLRGASLCPRCGADLGTPLMALEQADLACGEAVRALARGDTARAREAAARAHALHHTPLSRALRRWAADLPPPLASEDRAGTMPRINLPRPTGF